MRIISGKYKGKRITAPKKLPTRPTTDMAKEGLFNILNNNYYFDECVILDLFAGTGNICYEFASRGSQNITAVDANAYCTKFIAKTSNELELNIESVKSDVLNIWKGQNPRPISFSLILPMRCHMRILKKSLI